MTAKGLIKTIIALVIIGAGAAIGWAVATSTNPYAPGAGAATPAAAAGVQANNNAARPTAIPTFTPASGATGANTTPGAGRAANGQAGAVNGTPGAATGAQTGQGQRSAPVTGTVQTYDAASKVLTVKDAQGKSEEFDATNARLTKTEKLSADDFGKALSSNGIVLLTGEKGSDGSYNAVSLVALETGGFGGGNVAPLTALPAPGQVTGPREVMPAALRGPGRMAERPVRVATVVILAAVMRLAALAGQMEPLSSEAGHCRAINSPEPV